MALSWTKRNIVPKILELANASADLQLMHFFVVLSIIIKCDHAMEKQQPLKKEPSCVYKQISCARISSIYGIWNICGPCMLLSIVVVVVAV